MADLYQLLGVPRDASQEDIKRAYRRRARELHPDAGGDEDAFKQITRAYEVLSDPQRRAVYDRYGEEALRAGATGANDPFGFGGISDIVDAFFGGGFSGGSFRQGSATTPGRDVLVTVELDLEDVATGTEQRVPVDVAVGCETCGGSGSRSGTGPATCRTCGGAGQVRRVVRSAFGQIATARPCPDCGGSGRTVGDPCPDCGGEGRVRRARTVTVEVPAGVDDGDRLRVSSAGEAGRRGGAAGDLYVEVRVRPHEVFEREGRDLWCDVAIPFTQAALGVTLEVPTLLGETVTVEVPAGTQPGDVVSVRRAGLPRRRVDGRGGPGYDPGALHVRIDVEVPRSLRAEEEELLHRLAELRGEDVPAEGRGLFRRLREAFR